MPFSSQFPPLDIAQTNALSYLFSEPDSINDDPLWIEHKDTANSLTSRQAVTWIKRLGLGLQRMGLKRGDVVLICTPNHIYVPVAYLGTVGATCVFSGANPVYTVSELVHQLSDTGAKVVLSHPSKLDEIIQAADKVGVPRDRIYQFSESVNPVRQGIKDWTTILASAEDAQAWNWPELSPQEAVKTIATVNYSSGTTGLPKGVCITHANLIANVTQAIYVRIKRDEQGNPTEDPRRLTWLAFLPLYHAFGQMYTILQAIKLRATVYVMNKFVYEELLAAIEQYKVEDLQVAPPIIVMLCKRPETKKYDLSSLATITCGAAPLKSELQNECQRRFNLEIRQGWGMTEVTCGGSTSKPGLGDLTGAVGHILPNMQVKLLDDDGREVALGEPGELHVKGPNVCLGYWRNEKATKETLSDGWLKTGDVAVFEKSGKFWIVDRKKELIKVNGLQVAPAELEAVLLEHDAIADAAVVGITIGNDEWPRAYISLQDSSKGSVSAKDIQDWIAGRVSKHKRLEGGIAFVDEVPKLPSGKIVRKLMREWAKRDAIELEKNGLGAVAKARL